jgi:hypothetical protein
VNGAPPRLLAPGARRSKAWQAGVIAAALALSELTNPTRPLPFEVCGFHWLTGLPCPTCGMTRALCHALRGHWAQSVAWHPAGLILAAGLLGWMLWAAAEAWRGRPIAEAPRRRLANALIVAGVAVSGAFWVTQLADRL